MKQTINDLWYGRITPWEWCGGNDPKIRELLELMERNRGLVQCSTEEQRELLEKYTDCVEEYTQRMLEQAFSQGFVLGGRLEAEVLREPF